MRTAVFTLLACAAAIGLMGVQGHGGGGGKHSRPVIAIPEDGDCAPVPHLVTAPQCWATTAPTATPKPTPTPKHLP